MISLEMDSQLDYTTDIGLLFLIEHLDLVDVWLDEDQRTNTIKTLFKKRLNYVYEVY